MARSRVAMVSPVLPAGGNVTGTPAHVRKTIRALGDLGLEIHPLEIDLRGSIGRAARSVLAAWRELRRIRPSVVHAHGHLCAMAVLPLARASRVPVVCELHGVYVRSRRGQAGARTVLSWLASAAELRTMRVVDHVIAQAEAMAQRIVTDGHIPRERVTVIYPGCHTAEFSGFTGPPASIPSIGPMHKVAMYVGSTHSYQGLPLLAAAQRFLPAEYRVILVLSTDGGDPGAAVASAGFQSDRTIVVRPASPTELPALLSRADVLVHARPDCVDNVNVQSKIGIYLAAGMPIVATRVGDYANLLGTSEGCRVTSPEPREVAAAIVEAATNPAVRTAARTQNVELAERFFEAAKNGVKLVSLYEAVTGARR